jgi:hypothetical protein
MLSTTYITGAEQYRSAAASALRGGSAAASGSASALAPPGPTTKFFLFSTRLTSGRLSQEFP